MEKDINALREELLHLLSYNENNNCPVLRIMNLLCSKWRIYVFHELCKQPSCRFSEIQKSLPEITSTTLTTTLRELEQIGLVHREQFNEVPPHVEYSLTEKGLALIPSFYELTKWGMAYLDNR
ncbi:MAG: helix-turn-helix transcriptional regulator [Ruminiclostridium sp.]|nr:helix-turn-helix transcriptional regulator [Ruminiclostridium sp.]